MFTEISLIAAFKHVGSNISNLSVVCNRDSKLPRHVIVGTITRLVLNV
jgi:hypothetical protein